MIIAHISDLHFGRITHPGIVDALVREVNDGAVDLVALSGDLTQRARPGEFDRVRQMLDAIDPPVLVVPGNHDVFPWWRPFRRLATPLRRYRAYVTNDLTPTFERNGVAVLGVNSAFGATIKGGRIAPDDLDTIDAFFGTRSDASFNVLVVHHHLTKIQALGRHDVAWRAQHALDAAADAGVDLILCGHLHISHVEPLEIVPGRQRLVIASAGTATSNRGRKWHRETNFYNRIHVGANTFEVEERRYLPEDDRFVRDCTTTFDRDGAGRENGS